MEHNLTFDQLPQAVTMLTKEVSELKRLFIINQERGELPVMKRSKRLYFSSKELLAYLKGGRKMSNAEIEAEAEAYLTKSRKG
jgi:hypothetical protein